MPDHRSVLPENIDLGCYPSLKVIQVRWWSNKNLGLQISPQEKSPVASSGASDGYSFASGFSRFLDDLVIGDESGFALNASVNTYNIREYHPRGQQPFNFDYQRNDDRLS